MRARAVRVLLLPGLLIVCWLVLIDHSDRLSSSVENQSVSVVKQNEDVGASSPVVEVETEIPSAVKKESSKSYEPKADAPAVRLDNLQLGMTEAEAKECLETDDGEPPLLAFSDDGELSRILRGHTLSLSNGERLQVWDSREKLYRLLGEPDKHLFGMLGCGTDPLEYLYYQVEGGILVVNVVKPEYPSKENSQFPEEYWNLIAGISLSVPRDR